MKQPRKGAKQQSIRREKLCEIFASQRLCVRCPANSSLRLWHFEVDTTLYVLVECALLAFVIYHGWLICRLVVKSRKFGGGGGDRAN